MSFDRNRSLTFADAFKKGRPTAFSSMLKPVGSRCNMDCHYCYYLDKADIYRGSQPTMSLELLEHYIKEYIAANDVDQVTFCWHGGEPLLAGIDFYRKAVEFQNKYRGEKKIENALQTNGLLLDERWCELFAASSFLVGVSIDGPQDIHDACRLDRGGAPTFERVMRGIELMARMNVDYNTLSTVNRYSEGRGVEVYRFMQSIGSHYMQFLPVLEHVCTTEGNSRPCIVPPHTPDSRLAEWSVSAGGYGRFMIDIFDEWVLSDVGSYFVQLFDVALAQWYGVPPGLCAFAETCGDALVVEHNGDVYSCDHFVYPEYRLGNIATDSIREIYHSRKQFGFGLDKRNTLPAQCLRCKWYFACRGECPKHRFERSDAGEQGLNALCLGIKMFFSHVEPYMLYMKDLLDNKQPPALVMPWARQRIGMM
jgi:uncharacterized protein